MNNSDLNKEFYKYNKAINKLLDDSLKEGEYFLFTKKADNSFSYILSRERVEGISANKIHRVLDLLEDTQLDSNTYKMNIPTE